MSRNYKHLDREERYSIKEMRDKGFSINEISRKLQRSQSTISMELRRNKVNSRYMPCVAQEKYQERLHKQELLKIEKTPKLLTYIKDAMIKKKWSPDVIAGKLKLDADRTCCISTESIYRFVYTSPIAAKLKLYLHLLLKNTKDKSGAKDEKEFLYHKESRSTSAKQ